MPFPSGLRVALRSAALLFLLLSGIGYWAGRKERAGATEYFLAGKRLPWYVVGGSFIASNISTEHFIGMIGVAVVYGICVAMWGNFMSGTKEIDAGSTLYES